MRQILARLAWFFSVILLISNTHHAWQISIHPEREILYKDIHDQVRICVRSEASSSCKVNHPVHCNLEGLDEYREWRFKEVMSVSEIAPGPYQIQCSWNDSVPPTRRIVLLLAKYQVGLDCSAAPRFIHYDRKWPSFPWCCLRPMVPTQWLRRLPSNSIRLCGVTRCKSYLELFEFDHERALPRTQVIQIRKTVIQCEENFSRTVYFLRKGVQDLVMRASSGQAVLLKNQATNFTFCLGWDNAKSCELELNSEVHPNCTVSFYNFTARKFINPVLLDNNFRNIVDFSSWNEGVYWFQCEEPRAKISTEFPRLVLNEGHYRQNCSTAPDVIYLEPSREDYLFCLWETVVSRFWRRLAKRFHAERGSAIHCYSNPQGLHFDRGVLRTRVRHMIRGFVKVFCNPGGFEKTVFIADSPRELIIHLRPRNFILSNADRGKLRAEIGLVSDDDRVHRYLTSRFPVTCNITYPNQKRDFVWSFVGTTPLAALESGMLRIQCTQDVLRLDQLFHRILLPTAQGRPSCKPPRGLRTNNNPTWYQGCSQAIRSDKLVAAVHSSEDANCVDLHKEYFYYQGALFIDIPPVEPAMEPLLCYPKLHNVSVLIFEQDLVLKFDPEQPFYLAGQNQKVEASIAFRQNESHKPDKEQDELFQSLLAPLHLTCTIITRKNPNVTTTSSTLDLKSSIFFSGSSFYYIICETMDGEMSVFNDMFVFHPNDIWLKLFGSETKYLFEDESHEYTCILSGTSEHILESERDKPRWWSVGYTETAISIGNRIVINRDASLGKHLYECLYRRPWIELRSRLEFTISRRSEMKLITEYVDGSEKFLYLSNEKLPKISCSIYGGKLTVKDSVRWIMLRGDLTYSTEKRGSKVILIPQHSGSGFGVFRCVTVDVETCLTKIILLGVKNEQPNVRIVPQVRAQMLPFTVYCSVQEEITLFDLKATSVSEVKTITKDESVTFLDSETKVHHPLVLVSCEFKRLYLGIDIGSTMKIAVFDITVPTMSTINPLKEEYKFGEVIKCNGSSETRLVQHVVSYPAWKRVPQRFSQTAVQSETLDINSAFVYCGNLL
ncbi:hypothetical protein FGIG_07926 [Fasciola gigantica]|uniref:Ig-like domain-containing protein n=1 Tax=Fasciola gigantica TaxID=46835 RepID=A0A504YWR4_FASGI|nr:hypothetical protein FGIG_07926 [Fasciola gigantica]